MLTSQQGGDLDFMLLLEPRRRDHKLSVHEDGSGAGWL